MLYIPSRRITAFWSFTCAWLGNYALLLFIKGATFNLANDFLQKQIIKVRTSIIFKVDTCGIRTPLFPCKGNVLAFTLHGPKYLKFNTKLPYFITYFTTLYINFFNCNWTIWITTIKYLYYSIFNYLPIMYMKFRFKPFLYKF